MSPARVSVEEPSCSKQTARRWGLKDQGHKESDGKIDQIEAAENSQNPDVTKWKFNGKSLTRPEKHRNQVGESTREEYKLWRTEEINTEPRRGPETESRAVAGQPSAGKVPWLGPRRGLVSQTSLPGDGISAVFAQRKWVPASTSPLWSRCSVLSTAYDPLSLSAMPRIKFSIWGASSGSDPVPNCGQNLINPSGLERLAAIPLIRM